eukprot:11220107-Lingulodinium_polyedra.AAC.1
MSISELQERGRWSADALLRTYLDQVAAASVAFQVPQVDAVADWFLGDFLLPLPAVADGSGRAA